MVKRLKNYLRRRMGSDRLSALAFDRAHSSFSLRRFVSRFAELHMLLSSPLFDTTKCSVTEMFENTLVVTMSQSIGSCVQI